MKFWKYIFIVLLLVLSLVFIAFLQLPDGNLHIIACNVGQGDAILIIYKNIQILTDGGPDSRVLTCLGKYLPFWDREIELVISSHPDADHSTGLAYVIRDYKVDTIIINPIDPGTQIYELLKKEVGGKRVSAVNPLQGMVLRLGLISLDIENPKQELLDKLVAVKEGDKLSKYSVSGETNLYSIAYRLSFKSFSGFFLGDIPPEVSDSLAVNSLARGVDYIKIPHHGSKNGLTESLLGILVPKVAIISVGKNPWGLPSREVLDMLKKFNIKILRTDEIGDIKVITDGNRIWSED